MTGSSAQLPVFRIQPLLRAGILSVLLLVSIAGRAAAQFPAFPPSACVSNIENATVIILEQAVTGVTGTSDLQDGDPIVAVTPDEQTCTGEATLTTASQTNFAIAGDDPTSPIPGYQDGDEIRFWAQAQNGFVYELTPNLEACQPGEPLCVDTPQFQTDGIYTVESFTPVLLPVELARFELTQDDTRVTLRWATISETNNDGFWIEQRVPAILDLAEWKRLAFIPGEGTTTRPQFYRFTTDPLAPGEYLFRLVQQDVDGGETEFSAQRAIIHGDFDAIGAPSPHPLRSNATVSMTVDQTEMVRIVLYNTLGQEIAVLHDGLLRARQLTTFTIPADELASGLYLVRAVGESFRSTRRVVVAR